MERSLPVAERPRRPEWMKVRAPSADSRYFDVRKLLHGASLNTICEEARCPNIAECWGRGTATFQILGDTCTRACRYCYVHSGKPDGAAGPARAAPARGGGRQMDLKHVVVTSVDRDDLPDRGAGHYAATIRALKRKLPEASIEILTPDFLGCEEEALRTVLAERPDVFNHNIETVRRLHARMRGAKASYDKALWLLAAGEGGRRLPGADEVRDHRRARRDERRGRRDDARPPRARRRRGHDRPVPAAELEAREDRPLGAPRRVPLVPRAGRGARLRLGLLRAARAQLATARTSSATRPRPAAAPSPYWAPWHAVSGKERGPPEGGPLSRGLLGLLVGLVSGSASSSRCPASASPRRGSRLHWPRPVQVGDAVGRLDLEVHDLVARHALRDVPAAAAVVVARAGRRSPCRRTACASASSRTTSLTGRSPSSRSASGTPTCRSRRSGS